ncbi:D-alanyl-D-alanine carboxypeptidase [Nocardiopsis mwathae]|uniref:D-alanyl-D-alanine carboxypeptidase n=1 Tax=Nocardiopsis mwathae TaxID=1472723 RepID=A0A7W9YGU7_9ACTN|nr:serine hydrolase domain-containing protein [Nocardiopsis mwathae]MBB6171256.1 D-alanyl-D-alanine carboxypeptidase [Nocardiopsis mwathae]
MAEKRSKTKLSIIIGTVCATMLTLSGPAASAQTTEQDHPATLAALKAFQRSAGPGAAVHAGDGNDTWTLSVGTGTVNANRPIQSDEHFRIASQTKTFTAAVVLQLVDEGEVALDDPIEDYLPGVVTGDGYDGTRITVRHLLQHTGGLAPYAPHPHWLGQKPPANPDGTYDLAASVRKGLSYAPVSAPGAGWTYSNTGYFILGMLIEEVTGMAVHEAITGRIIEPLGLNRTAFPAPGDRALPTPAVNGYEGIRVGGFFAWRSAPTYDPSLYSSVGAMTSTLEDMTEFYRALTDGKVVSPAGLAEMQKIRDMGDSVRGYGLGLMRHELSCGGEAWGHGGDVPGYSTYTLVTEDGRHAALVTNAGFVVISSNMQLRLDLMDTALCEGQPPRS